MHISRFLSMVLLCVLLIVPALSEPLIHPRQSWYLAPLPLPVKVVHQFPVGTWLEDLAVRHDGKILTTALTSPEVFQVDNLGVEPVKVVHTFADATSCTGITELGRDEFFVIVGNMRLSTLSTVPGSWSVYRVDVHHHHHHTTKPKPAQVSLVANFPDSILLNGITVLHKKKKWLLVGDSGAGIVYRLETKTGKVVKVLDDPLMKPDSNSFGIGINGIKIKSIKDKGNILYFTNSDRNILARVSIHKDGRPKEPATTFTQIDGPNGFSFTGESDGVFYAQNGVNLLGRVSGTWAQTVVTLAGAPSDIPENQLFGPTAVEFGRVKPVIRGLGDYMGAYISTNGGTTQYVTGNVTRGGTISSVAVDGYLTWHAEKTAELRVWG